MELEGSATSNNGQIEVVKLLLEKGADLRVANKDGWTPLYTASVRGHSEVVKLLLERGADWAAANSNGWMPLHAASNNGHVEVVKMLLERGADWAAANSNGWTPLHIASNNGHVEVVKMLLERGADLAIVDNSGRHALHLAAESGKNDVMKILISRGAQIFAKDSLRRPPLFYSMKAGDCECLRILAYEQMDPNTTDCYGSTLLSIAVRYGHQNVVECLLRSLNINSSLADHFGRSPIWWAQKQGYTKIVELLRIHARNTGLVMPAESVKIGEPVDFHSPRRSCDVCLANTGTVCVYCAHCSDGDFDICLLCERFGAHCLDESHSLLPRENM